jgi:hypothetical protein
VVVEVVLVVQQKLVKLVVMDIKQLQLLLEEEGEEGMVVQVLLLEL